MPTIVVGGLDVLLPYEPYAEQLEYMLQLKAALDQVWRCNFALMPCTARAAAMR